MATLNDPLILDPRAVKAVLVGGVWHEVLQESFRLTRVEIGEAGELPWEPAFAFRTDASSEHAYSSVVVVMSGPVSSIQAVRSAT
jgi:hypothetical protein